MISCICTALNPKHSTLRTVVNSQTLKQTNSLFTSSVFQSTFLCTFKSSSIIIPIDIPSSLYRIFQPNQCTLKPLRRQFISQCQPHSCRYIPLHILLYPELGLEGLYGGSKSLVLLSTAVTTGGGYQCGRPVAAAASSSLAYGPRRGGGLK
jgi:hypothetical protein